MSDKWDRRFVALAEHIAGWSRDPSTRVGAVIVDAERRIVSQGYNGLPRGVLDLPERLDVRETKLRMTLHAELNALLFAARSVAGCTCYVWPLPPCAQCAAALVQSGIARIVAPEPGPEIAERWGPDLDLAAQMYAEAGVMLTVVPGAGA